MQELCLKNCDQDVAGQKLENLSKGGMVWEETVYRKGFLPFCMLAASAAKAPRIPLASSNGLTNDRGSSPLLSRHGSQGNCHSCHTGSQTGYTPRKQQRTHQDECPSRFKLWGQHYMAHPAQLHASAALAPYCLKNCDADAAGQKLENLSKRGMVWERARSRRREGWGPAGGCAGPKEG